MSASYMYHIIFYFFFFIYHWSIEKSFLFMIWCNFLFTYSARGKVTVCKWFYYLITSSPQILFSSTNLFPSHHHCLRFFLLLAGRQLLLSFWFLSDSSLVCESFIGCKTNPFLYNNPFLFAFVFLCFINISLQLHTMMSLLNIQRVSLLGCMYIH